MIFEAPEALAIEFLGADVALSDGFAVCEVHACYGGEVVERCAEGWECCCACADSDVDKALFEDRRIVSKARRGLGIGIWGRTWFSLRIRLSKLTILAM